MEGQPEEETEDEEELATHPGSKPDDKGAGTGQVDNEGKGEEGPSDQEKKDKLHDVIKVLSRMENIDTCNQLIGIVKNSAQVDVKAYLRESSMPSSRWSRTR